MAKLNIYAVRNWEFFQPPTTGAVASSLGGEANPLRMLKRRTSLVVADLPMSPVAAQMPVEMKSGGLKPQPPPTVFEEPDANSLLDSFGF